MSEKKGSAYSRLSIKVIPNAKRDELTGYKDGILLIKVTAVPEKGKANQAVISLLAEKLGVRKTSIEITRGQTSRNKTIIIYGISNEELLSQITI